MQWLAFSGMGILVFLLVYIVYSEKKETKKNYFTL